MAQDDSTYGYALVDSVTPQPLGANHEEHEYDAEVHLASLAEKKRLWWRNAFINASFIASWFLFATVISVYNKWMFSPDHFGFPSPLFVTTIHMLVQFCLAALLRGAWPAKFRPERSPTPSDYIRKAVPTGITTGLDIGLSNLSLKLITLSFYTMCKSSSLIFVLLFAFLFRLETFSFRLVGVITLIFAGVLLMVATETHFVLSGFVLVMSASALGGFRWSLTQLLLRSKNMGLDNPAATLFWLSPTMGITLAITSAIVDGWSKIFGSHFFDGGLQTLRTCFFLVSPGILAFCMVLSEFYIIQRAGVVPMSIAGIAKEVTTITISAWFFGDELTPLNITGVAITACGIALYTYHKYRKSMDESVPLDPHGNPIADDEGITNSSVALEDALPGERQRLRSDSDSRSSQESRSEPTSLPNGGEVLFDVGREDYNELIAEETSTATHEGTVWSPPYRIGDTQDFQTVWKEDVGAGDRC